MSLHKRCVVLLSGGLDSATVVAVAQNQKFKVHAITFRYGQRHSVEVQAAKRVAEERGVAGHVIADVDLRLFGNSALTDEVPVPKNRNLEEMSAKIPVTYVPARNTIFLSFALGYAEVVGAFDIFVGVNALDYAGYPDCRPEYIAAYEAMANLATKSAAERHGKMSIHTPLIALSKSEIISKGLSLGVDFSLTSSCYDPSLLGEACGRCDACVLRLQGFAENGITDSVKYRDRQQVTV